MIVDQVGATLRQTRLGVTILLAAMIALWLGILATSTTASDPTPGIAKSAAVGRQREGSQLVNVLGYFKMSGDRATFYQSDGLANYPGLENLNLERVTLMIADNPEKMTWQVSGTITEFRGSNYLLLSKAILKGQTDAAEDSAQRPRARGLQKAPVPPRK